MGDVLIQMKTGTRAQIDAGSVNTGEIVLATDTKEVFIGDGTNKIFAGRVIINTYATRPTAGVSGRSFYATDTGEWFLDDGTQWLLISVSTDIAQLSTFFPVDYDTTIANYNVLSISGNSPFTITFRLPELFYSMESLRLIYFTTTTESGTSLTLDSNYASIGESYTTHTQSAVDQSWSTTANIITTHELKTMFADAAAGDMCGIKIEFNINKTFYIYGIDLDYYATTGV